MIGRAKTELLFIHGEQDLTIPIEHSERLLAAVQTPAFLYRIPGGGHVNQKETGGDQYRQVWKAFLTSGQKGVSTIFKELATHQHPKRAD
jgi:fermentation-respiration switch protein FrsA (DUF1100 family)